MKLNRPEHVNIKNDFVAFANSTDGISKSFTDNSIVYWTQSVGFILKFNFLILILSSLFLFHFKFKFKEVKFFSSEIPLPRDSNPSSSKLVFLSKIVNKNNK